MHTLLISSMIIFIFVFILTKIDQYHHNLYQNAKTASTVTSSITSSTIITIPSNAKYISSTHDIHYGTDLSVMTSIVCITTIHGYH